MPIWRLEPKAAPDDPRWLDHEIWEEVLVKAPTSGMARLAASRLEFDPSRPPTGNENPSFHSAFADEKLYAVSLHDEGDDGEPRPAVAPGEACVLRAVQATRQRSD